MARTGRIDIEDSWYHIISRGLNRSKIFLAEEDYRKYLNLLNETLERYNGYIGAYCLMPNHIHLLIYRREHPLSSIFHKVQGEYSRYYNRKNRRVGYLFQGRYKSKIVLSDKYLNALVCYIHKNPVRARISSRLDKYRWTSDRYYRLSSKQSELTKFMRVPGYEGKEGKKKYMEIINEEATYPESSSQFIGNKEDNRDIRSKKIKRYSKERRSVVPLEERIKEMTGRDKELIENLRSKSRKRTISGKRKEIMVQLYEEGYAPVIIADYFNRTPAAVVMAALRKS